MRSVLLLAFAAASGLGLVSCGPVPSSPPLPPVTTDSCTAAGATLDRLRCDWGGPTFVSDCLGADRSGREHGVRGIPAECIAHAASCDEAEACR